MTDDRQLPTTDHRPPDDAVGRRSSAVGRRSSPFDEMAASYDRTFTNSLIGTLMREAVWRRLDSCFKPGDRVLELNCGTGADAIYLGRRGVRVLATDIAPTMLEIARDKVARAGLANLVEVAQLAIEDLTSRQGEREIGQATFSCSPGLTVSLSEPFDGALSNFGGLNCVDNLRVVAAGLAARLRPGARAVLCVMGPLVPWEWAWYLRRGQLAKAFRRLRRGGIDWRGLTIRYPSVWAVRRAFAPAFRPRRVSAVGALVPPSYTEGWAARHPRLLARLNDWERRLETLPPLPWLADHYLMELERR
jgi:SAM-dependent methyltransferase